MIRTITTSNLSMALDHLGVDDLREGPANGNLMQQLEVMAAALDIYQERSRVRGETWAEFDHHDCIHHLNSKLARLRNAAQLLAGRSAAAERGDEVDEDVTDELLSAMEDDALDVINYAVFLVRHLTGRKPVKAIG